MEFILSDQYNLIFKHNFFLNNNEIKGENIIK